MFGMFKYKTNKEWENTPGVTEVKEMPNGLRAISYGENLRDPIHSANLEFMDSLFAGMNAVLEGHFPTTNYEKMDRFLPGIGHPEYRTKRAEFVKMTKDLKNYEVCKFDDRFLVKTGLSSIEEVGPYVKKLEYTAIALSRNLHRIKDDELKRITTLEHFKLGIKKLFKGSKNVN